ncbi:unnamed protein product [Mytilus coruscus]|uniref:CCHC-type domain-containing protein n=1 Tax=Mytilus coruscus TaxID=42192 RepID=A0A6J8BGP9_MYTCO|nr:unnamed protein product [Mytilus coruscus]
MEIVDYGLLRCSAKFTFTDGSPVNTRTWIIRILKNIVNPEDVTAIFKVDIGGTWYTTFTTEEIADKVINSDFSSLDTRVTVSRSDTRTVLLKVLWLPVWLKLTAVESFLEQYGKVVSCSRETEKSEGITFANGNIRVTLEISEKDVQSLPYRTTIAGKDCLLTVVGRAPLCLKCKTVGHIRKNCPLGKKSTVPLEAVSIPETQNSDISDDTPSDIQATQDTSPVTQETTQETVDTDKSSPSSKLWSDIAADPDDLSGEIQFKVVGGKKRKVVEVKKDKFELRFIQRHSGKVVPALGRIDENGMLVSFILSDDELMDIIGKEPDRRKHRQLLIDTLQTDIDIQIRPQYYDFKL